MTFSPVQTNLGTLGLVDSDALLVVQDLTMEVRQLDVIVVHDCHVACTSEPKENSVLESRAPPFPLIVQAD